MRKSCAYKQAVAVIEMLVIDNKSEIIFWVYYLCL